MENNIVYDLRGNVGKHLTVYPDKVVIKSKAGIASFLVGNSTDGEKTIYFADCIGIQYKKSGLTIGYVQFETSSGMMNNRSDNYWSENSFTWEKTKLPNEKMEEVVAYCKKQMDICKSNRNAPVVQTSAADELVKFKSLLDAGVISQEEFDTKKKQLLGI